MQRCSSTRRTTANTSPAGQFRWPASSRPAEPAKASPTPAESGARRPCSRRGSRRHCPRPASAGGSTAQAVENARAAEAAGAEGILLLPPYLTEADQGGLIDHVSAICRSTSLGVIIYNRANAIYKDTTVATLADRHENLIGFKDGVGDLEHDARVYAKLGDRLFYLGGLPTAETFALPLLQLGMSTYSSAMYNFVPQFALDFYQTSATTTASP